jgi:TonB-dependent starch-binding outer membrane protein SusC
MVGGRVKLVELVTLYSDTSYSTDVMISEFFLNGLVLSFNIDNLHTFTKYTGMNPEANTFRSATAPGIDRTGYPLSRNFTIGLKATL